MVSIIIATYNAAETISRALDSVLNQTFQDWECVIIDGASRDATIDIVKTYMEKDKRIRYVSEPDKGIYDAFNKGWKMAKGDWIYYLGSDDKLTVESFNGLPFDCDSDIAIINGSVKRITRSGKCKICNSCGFNGSHQGQITKKSVIEEMDGFDLSYRIVGDFELNTRIELAGYKVINTKSVIAHFQSGGTSERFKFLLKTTKERYRVYCKNVHYRFPLMSALKSFIKNIIYISYSHVYKQIHKM